MQKGLLDLNFSLVPIVPLSLELFGFCAVMHSWPNQGKMSITLNVNEQGEQIFIISNVVVILLDKILTLIIKLQVLAKPPTAG